MEKNKSVDVLLVGRPDHSMLIYDALTKQDELSYHFITFKVIPEWMGPFTGKLRVQYVSRCVSIGLKSTIVNICKYPLHLGIAKKWKEKGLLAGIFNRFVKKHHPKVIHYWSTYANEAVENYIDKHPESIAIKDIHMPSYDTVAKAMFDVATKYGMPELWSHYNNLIAQQAEELKNVANIIVPSEYVLNSFKSIFPDKQYSIVSYGISKSPLYQKHKHVKEGHKYRFVYVGRISLEKGCDILFDYFRNHPEYELHVYGAISDNQREIFNKLVSPNILIHGVIDKKKVQETVASYDIGMHLSRFDAYSLAVGEVIGAGLPVIVSKTTGNESDVRVFGWGEVTDNTMDDIHRAVISITSEDKYNGYIDSIDTYLKSDVKGFGEKMVDFYSKLIN